MLELALMADYAVRVEQSRGRAFLSPAPLFAMISRGTATASSFARFPRLEARPRFCHPGFYAHFPATPDQPLDEVAQNRQNMLPAWA